MTRNRAPLDATGGRATSTQDLQLASGIVDRSGVVETLEPFFTADTGRHRVLGLRALLVACQLNALSRHHKAHLIEVARIINALTADQRALLGIADHDPDQTYDRVDRTFTKLAAVLEAGHPGINAKWLANALAQAAIPDEFRTSSSVAVDGTDVETCGALHGDAVTVDLDGEAAETQLTDDGSVPKPKKPARRAKVWASVSTDASNTPSTPTHEPDTGPQPTAAPPDHTSDTSCTSQSKHVTSNGPTTSTRSPSPTKSPASSHASHSHPQEATAAGQSSTTW